MFFDFEAWYENLTDEEIKRLKREESKMNSVYVIHQLPINNPNTFLEYNEETFDLKDYVRVWGDEWDDDMEDLEQLEEIYERFNCYHPEHFAGHSLSVSDLIEVIDGETNTSKYFYCSGFGFLELDKFRKEK